MKVDTIKLSFMSPEKQAKVIREIIEAFVLLTPKEQANYLYELKKVSK